MLKKQNEEKNKKNVYKKKDKKHERNNFERIKETEITEKLQ